MTGEHQSTPKPLGRWHLWWLRQFRDAYAQKDAYAKRGERHSGGICVDGYGGTVQGKALAGLMTRGLVAHRVSFEGGAAILCITDEGLRHV